MKVWLLRHGEAEPARGRDADRQLTEHGRYQVRSMAALLAGQPLTQVLCSPYVRTRQTADELLAALPGQHSPQVVPWLTPEDSPQAVVRQLDHMDGHNLLLISHQPLLGLLGSWLCEGSLQYPLAMSTASLACLEGDHAVAGLMRLQSLTHAATAGR
ncbi:MAG: phosphohistidine phosphatase SixA [Thiopseudomonas sp.]